MPTGRFAEGSLTESTQRLKTSLTRALIAAGVFLLAHGTAIAVFKSHAKVVSYLFLIAGPLLCSAACVACARIQGLALNWYAAA